MGNTAVANLGRLVLCVHNDKPPSAAEWQSYLDVTKSAADSVGGDFSKIRTMVFTDGGGPNAVQRAAVNKLIGEKPSPGAIITQSTVVRGIVTALSWFNPAIKAFHPRDLRDAVTHLGLTSDDTAMVGSTLKSLQTQVEGVQILAQVPAL